MVGVVQVFGALCTSRLQWRASARAVRWAMVIGVDTARLPGALCVSRLEPRAGAEWATGLVVVPEGEGELVEGHGRAHLHPGAEDLSLFQNSEQPI